MDDLEYSLTHITLAPYIVKAMALIGVRRRAGSNMFRHQISTLGILLDYKTVDPILLKASVIHDLFEDALNMPGVTEQEITQIDADGPAVYALVMEVRSRGGRRPQPKTEYCGGSAEDGVRGAAVRRPDRSPAALPVNDPPSSRQPARRRATYPLHADRWTRTCFSNCPICCENRQIWL
jgi:hypothetical protein